MSVRSIPAAPFDPKQRLMAVAIFCLIFAAGLGFRAAFLQILPNQRLAQLAKRQFQSKVLVSPRRGLILDRNGEALAINVETNSLAANPSKIKNKSALAAKLARATGISQHLLLKRLIEGKEFVWIKRHISDEEFSHFRRNHLIDEDGDWVNGLWLIKESKRVYPHHELAAHTLGDVNIDTEGLEGVELWFNEKMAGKIVSVDAVRDALGRPAFLDSAAASKSSQSTDGESIQLTLDASLQFVVEQKLRASIQKSQARGGSVIVMNAVTGEILALANQPAFDPNEKGIPVDRRRNRVFTDGYEPGSTLKAVLAASALSHGIKMSEQVWGGDGKVEIQGHQINEAEAHEKFQWLSLSKMLQVSSNVGAAKFALKLGTESYYNTLKTFGFGAKTGSGFPGEIGGKIPAKKTWQPLSLATIGFGQGILVTPIQMTRAYAALINGGWLIQPTLLKSSLKDKHFQVDPPKRVITPGVAEQVVEALSTVTQEGGTGIKANVPGYRVAGKTGTAQAVDPHTGKYSRSHYVASFIGFPLGLPHKFVIFTSVDGPQGVYYASETAAPLFSEVLSAVANRFSLPTEGTPQRVLAKAPTARALDHLGIGQSHPIPPSSPIMPIINETIVPKRMELVGAEPNGTHNWRMPVLKGLTAREALRVLQGHKFDLEVSGTGLVSNQIPEEGRMIQDGEKIRIKLNE